MNETQPPTNRLTEQEIHVRWTTLDRPPDVVRAMDDLLSQDERARAARYRSPRDRDRFVVARGFLRTLIGGYLDITPPAVAFHYAPHGKPEVTPSSGGNRLQFNASRSDNLALFGFTVNRRIGVDIERVRDDLDCVRFAERCFAPAEAATLRALRPEYRSDAFFAFWTAKEAFLKAEGVGLLRPLDAVEVALSEERLPEGFERIGGSRAESARWQVASVTTLVEYRAAVVSESALGLLPYVRVYEE